MRRFKIAEIQSIGCTVLNCSKAETETEIGWNIHYIEDAVLAVLAGGVPNPNSLNEAPVVERIDFGANRDLVEAGWGELVRVGIFHERVGLNPFRGPFNTKMNALLAKVESAPDKKILELSDQEKLAICLLFGNDHFIGYKTSAEIDPQDGKFKIFIDHLGEPLLLYERALQMELQIDRGDREPLLRRPKRSAGCPCPIL
jgi:hypothetical protein